MIDEQTTQKLETYIKRIDVIQADIDSAKEDLKNVFKEMKDDNFDLKAVKQILKLRKMEKIERDEQDFVVGEYRKGLGV